MRGFLAVILVGLLFISSLGYVAKRLQNPEFLVAQAREVNFYGRLAQQFGENLPEDFIKGYPLTKEETTAVITETISAETFYDFMETYAGAYLDYLTGKSPDVSYQYNLVEIKRSLVESLTTKLLAKYQTLPTCTAEQTRAWDISEEYPVCKLPAGSIEDSSIDSQLRSQLVTQVNQFPDEVKSSTTYDDDKGLRNIVSIVNTAINIAWIATLLLAILMLIIWRQKSFVALGISLLFVGLVQIGFSLIAWDWIAQNISDAFASRYGGTELAPLAIDMAGVVLEVLKRTLGNLTIVIIGAGAALLVLGIVAAVKGRKTISLPG